MRIDCLLLVIICRGTLIKLNIGLTQPHSFTAVTRLLSEEAEFELLGCASGAGSD
jgi:hypothetical protein